MTIVDGGPAVVSVTLMVPALAVLNAWTSVPRGDTILVKGSHSLALDKLADALVQTAAKA